MFLWFISNLLKPSIEHAFGWLSTRALIIPAEKLTAVAAAAGVTPEALQSANKTVVTEGLDLAGEYMAKHWGL